VGSFLLAYVSKAVSLEESNEALYFKTWSEVWLVRSCYLIKDFTPFFTDHHMYEYVVRSALERHAIHSQSCLHIQ
jgi:hypothetical protein